MKAMPLTDSAWALIVNAAPAGVRGRVFRMSTPTWQALCAERGQRRDHLQLYSVPVQLDEIMRYWIVELAEKVVRPGARRNVFCSICGDTRGGPAGHETSECTYRGMER